ncbi:MAG: serine/threonine protein kinase [Chloroflexi bacterium]|nr:serine/threonine protein kinase [Chloroflexota bacterium]MCI0580268.1 serine/threonine protein kinase [Chloroflexota bacterium]MCI0643679.1 serine/threonine protein kinase [Chloroflexota bacterium]MCI0729063.1 serine/threonine protein kinase [Chloroflexota bacterium]
MAREQTYLGAKYYLEEEVGQGSIGAVYRAWDIEHSQRVAVKVIHRRYRDDPRVAVRFRQQLKAVSGLTHGHLAAIQDYGYGNDGFYIVSEWVDGPDLATHLARHGSILPLETLVIARQICAAVEIAHQHGLVHRGIRPRNILLTADGQVKVSDVGLAGIISESGLSKTTVMLEGASYMSPELARGEKVGPESDVYSIGVVLFEMLTGRLPFVGNNAWSVAFRHAQEAPPSPREFNQQIPLALARVVERALQKERGARFATVMEMDAELAKVSAEGDAPAGAPRQFRPVTRLAPLASRAPGQEKVASPGARLTFAGKATQENASAAFRPALLAMAGWLAQKLSFKRVLVLSFVGGFIIAFAILFPLSGLVLQTGATVNSPNQNDRVLPGSRDPVGRGTQEIPGTQPDVAGTVEARATPTPLPADIHHTPGAATGFNFLTAGDQTNDQRGDKKEGEARKKIKD